MIAHMSYVMCDRCGNPSEMADNAKEARRLAAREGYFQLGRGRDGEDICRECADRARREQASP